jgi:hypothetical protein
MPILPTDIKLLESERMRDTPDGGGRQTGREIPSGVVGNVFPKVSRVDSVYGRVNLRKIYVAVRTATLDMYAGAHAIITRPPENDRIGCCLFSTASSFDTRAAARDRIESYVVAGPLSRLRLLGNQIIGQKAILCYQQVSEPLPDVGEVLVLSQENAQGVASAQQYVRITDVAHEVRTFTDQSGEFQRRVVTLKIGSSLQQTFSGNEASRFTANNDPTKVRDTSVADASKYYGIQPLAEAGELGAMTLRLMSVYAPLVPSTQRETAVSLAEIAGASTYQNSTAGVVSENAFNLNPGQTRYFNRAIKPGSIRAQRTGGSLPITSDDGNGTLKVWGSSVIEWVFSVDYENGSITGVTGFEDASIGLFQYERAVNVSNPAHTRAIPITLGTRGTVYAETLNPLPAPGTLIVDFRALGRWYRLRDNGSGELVANDPQEGTGSVNYATGAVIITLGALPDVGSSVILSWGSPVHYTIRAGATADAGTTLDLEYTLQNAPIVPGSVTISYPVGGVTRNVTDPAENGNLSGTGVAGEINYATGEVWLRFSTPPDRAAQLNNAYTWRDGASLYSGTSATISGGQFTVPGNPPFRNAGRMTFTAGAAGSLPAYIDSGGSIRLAIGGLQKLGSTIGATRIHFSAGQIVGSFDRATGLVNLTTIEAIASVYELNNWARKSVTYAITLVSNIQVERDTAAFDPNAITDETVFPSDIGLTLDLTTTIGDPVVAGSVMFRATGKTYIDRNGTLYTDVSPTTGSGLDAGRHRLRNRHLHAHVLGR